MVFRKARQRWLENVAPRVAQRFLTRLLIVVAVAVAVSFRSSAQSTQTPGEQPATVMGTVTDVNGDGVTGATVVITGPGSLDRRTVVTDENGFFEFKSVKASSSYQIFVTAAGFADWTSPVIALAPGEFKLLGNIQLRVATQRTTVHVAYNPVEKAAEQLNAEEKQRALGIIPNFYVSYEGEGAAPLTTKMKFKLALKISYDPVTVLGVAMVSGARQATNSPKYGQGWAAYGERFGATAADGFTDIMIGGAILPSLLHEDPRYFYQGTGTTKSRIRHAMLSPFIARRDNGTWGPNYSSLGGDLASSAISNLYFPRANRGAGLVFSQFAIGTAERVGASLAQEFLLSRFTHRAGHIE
jgi:Carboxypeptidase regulatory-like domain